MIAARAVMSRWTTLLALMPMLMLAPASAAASDLRKTLVSNGLERSYSVHLPQGNETKAGMALVVVLHGGGGNAEGAARQTQFSAEADRAGFIVAYPDGTGTPGMPGKAHLTWNAGGCCAYAMKNGIDDVAFVRALVEAIAREHAIDRGRVYATGLSNGAMMAYRLACEASDVFAAVGIVAGVVVTTPCAPTAPVAVIHIHGSADENVPLAGGIGRKSITRTAYPPVAESIALWARADGCGSEPSRTQAAPGVSENWYQDCRAGSAVSFYLIVGGGHSWPGGERMAFFLDSPSSALSATPVIWRFFAAHPQHRTHLDTGAPRQ
jgi:polyhydroxybutyrate depolymerase